MNDTLYAIFGLILTVILIGGPILIILWAIKKPKERKKLKAENDKLLARVKQLEPYQEIPDIKSEVAKITAKSHEEAERILRGARNQKLESEALITDAKRRAEIIISESSNLSDLKIQDADRIAKEKIDHAESEAHRIAGEALKALEEYSKLDKKAVALKNIIEGYGDAYIQPMYSILDDLATDFSFKEAGIKLKEARNITKQLIKTGKAADCNYVEPHRRNTAIKFVVDAFNGKVDSILSTVKNDNFGTLKQKILDAFTLVNSNGEAFRDARITKDYLEARNNELYWAAICMELKAQEQEEQRRIKEILREEEKAAREYAKAMADAQKEEDMLRKAIDKATREVQSANEEQKAKYEATLAQLQLRLNEAEEKNKRAISMAQQTKSGYVYIISNIGSFGEDVFKIGMTRRLEPLDRVRELGDASVPFEFDVHAMIYSENAPALEHELHKKFVLTQVNKVNPRKEFFKLSLNEIKRAVDQNEIDIVWTLKAEAKQYRESLKIEKEILASEAKRREWEHSQIAQDSIIAATEPLIAENVEY